jgi:predicted transcriptional regulator of viral defense system
VTRLTEQFLQSPTGVFTQSEVAVALNGSTYSRHGLVERALADGDILGIRRGLYCLEPRYWRRPVSVYALSQCVHGPSYVSMESALAHHGWIPEAVYACTCASYGNAREYRTPLGVFSYRRVPQRVFFEGVDRCVDPDGNVYFMASPAKALADYVYVHNPGWRRVDDAAASLRVEPEDWMAVDPEQLGALAQNYTNGRVRQFLAAWRESIAS